MMKRTLSRTKKAVLTTGMVAVASGIIFQSDFVLAQKLADDLNQVPPVTPEETQAPAETAAEPTPTEKIKSPTEKIAEWEQAESSITPPIGSANNWYCRR